MFIPLFIALSVGTVRDNEEDHRQYNLWSHKFDLTLEKLELKLKLLNQRYL